MGGNANVSACENAHKCVLSVHTRVCPPVQELHVLRWDVRNLFKQSWNLAQVKSSGHSHPPPETVHHFLCADKEVAVAVREAQLAKG